MQTIELPVGGDHKEFTHNDTSGIVLGKAAAFLAHELRNPLAATRLYLELLNKENLGGRAPDLIQAIERTLGQMNQVVDNVMQFSRAGLQNQFSIVNLLSLAEEFKLQYNEMLSCGSLEINSEGGAFVVGDECGLRQVFHNLLRNGAEAMNYKGSLRVWIRPGREPGMLRCEISDTGPGIPATMRERLFEPFETEKNGGTGLGLAVVSQVLQAHKAKFGAFNAAGGGAVFWFEIPQNAAKM